MVSVMKIAQVGVGSRGRMYWDAVTARYADRWRLVGLCDSNPGRLELARKTIAGRGIDVPGYAVADFEKMLSECRPSVVVVTSMDSTHDQYICKALSAGADVITEKPLTIDEVRLQRIVDTVRKTGRSLRVTFNYRWSPVRAKVKELLAGGIAGEVLSVDFKWNLDTSHGADYYRRWHRNKKNSGGLMVHKATHHFDLVNWWLGTVPEMVFAVGRRGFYLDGQAASYGLEGRGERCHECPVSARCNFFLDLAAHEGLKRLYLDSESHDGYYRDRCVFSPEIDIEDSMCLAVRYKSGALMSYSLNSFLPWEGYEVAFNGTRGRLEHRCQETVYVSGDGTTPGEMKTGDTTITFYPHFAAPVDIAIPDVAGGHGGGDEPLLEDLFGGGTPPDPLGRRSDYRAGAWSILTGIAANKSIAAAAPVTVTDLVHGLDLP